MRDTHADIMACACFVSLVELHAIRQNHLTERMVGSERCLAHRMAHRMAHNASLAQKPTNKNGETSFSEAVTTFSQRKASTSVLILTPISVVVTYLE